MVFSANWEKKLSKKKRALGNKANCRKIENGGKAKNDDDQRSMDLGVGKKVIICILPKR